MPIDRGVERPVVIGTEVEERVPVIAEEFGDDERSLHQPETIKVVRTFSAVGEEEEDVFGSWRRRHPTNSSAADRLDLLDPATKPESTHVFGAAASSRLGLR